MVQHRHYISDDYVSMLTTPNSFNSDSLDEENFLDRENSPHYNGTFADMLEHEDYNSTAYFDAEKLKNMIDEIADGDRSYIKITLGNNLPIIIGGINYSTPSDTFSRGTVAPVRSEKLSLEKRFADAERYAGHYYVKSIDEDWSDTYPTLNAAREAASEHLYLTGSQTKIYTPTGRKISGEKK